MDVQVGDVIRPMKPHPVRCEPFTMYSRRHGFQDQCQGCGHEIMLPRAKIERNIKKVLRTGEQ